MSINLNLTIEIMETVVLIVAVATGIYEVLTRVVPTSKTWSIIGNVLNLLSKISETLDNKKQK